MSVLLIAFRYFNFSMSISIENERAKIWVVLSIVILSQKNFNLRWEENNQFKHILKDHLLLCMLRRKFQTT